jgi:hypothetical protein
MKFEFSVQIFEKNSQIKNCTKIRFVGAEIFHVDGRTDRHEDAKGRFSKFCDRVSKPMNCAHIKLLKHFMWLSDYIPVIDIEKLCLL